MRIKVKDVMNREPIVVLPSDSVQECARLMYEYNIGIIPVVSAGSFKGLITDRTIAIKLIASGIRPKDVKVSEIMEKDISFLVPQQRLRDIITIMSCEKLRKLPVLQDGMLEGIVTVRDIMKYCTQSELLRLAENLL